MTELRTAIDHYHSLIDDANARATFEHLEAEQRKRGMLVGKARDRLICAVLRPRFVTHAQYATVTKAATLVGGAIRDMGAACLDDPNLLQAYKLEPIEHELLSIDPGYAGATVFGRLDGFLGENGEWCYFIESNLESPAGIAYDEALIDVFDQTELMRQFREHYTAESVAVRKTLQQTLLDTYRAWGGSGTPSVAIVDFRSVVTNSEFTHIRDAFQADGIPALIADPSEMRYNGGRLYVGATPIDLVYRRVLQHEFLAQYDLRHPLVQAYADRAVCVVNPFRTKPVHTKLIMALISDEDGGAREILSAEELDAVQRHVPWTRHVRRGTTRYNGERVDLLKFVLQHRERLVLKPNDEYGGKGVTLGWETSAQQWESALNEAMRTPSVVQEAVPLPQELYPTWDEVNGVQITPRYVDSDPVVFGDAAQGCLTRIAATSLLNVTAGGGAAPPTFLIAKR